MHSNPDVNKLAYTLRGRMISKSGIGVKVEDVPFKGLIRLIATLYSKDEAKEDVRLVREYGYEQKLDLDHEYRNIFLNLQRKLEIAKGERKEYEY